MELNTECKVCENRFRPEALVGGICKPCRKKYPGIDSKEELKSINTKIVAESLNEKKVRTIVYEILEEAGIKRAKCACGRLFFKRSPAQKQCEICKNKERK